MPSLYFTPASQQAASPPMSSAAPMSVAPKPMSPAPAQAPAAPAPQGGGNPLGGLMSMIAPPAQAQGPTAQSPIPPPQPTQQTGDTKILSRAQVKQIITGAPKGTDPSSIVTELVNRGYHLEGYGEPAAHGFTVPFRMPTMTATPFQATDDTSSMGGLAGNAMSMIGNLLPSVAETAINLPSNIVNGGIQMVQDAGRLGQQAMHGFNGDPAYDTSFDTMGKAGAAAMQDPEGTMKNINKFVVEHPGDVAMMMSGLLEGAGTLTGSKGLSEASDLVNPLLLDKAMVKRAAPMVKKAVTQVVGATTGAGQPNMEVAAETNPNMVEKVKQLFGMKPQPGAKEYNEANSALTGEDRSQQEQEIIDTARKAMKKVELQRRTEYQQALAKITTGDQASQTPAYETPPELKTGNEVVDKQQYLYHAVPNDKVDEFMQNGVPVGKDGQIYLSATPDEAVQGAKAGYYSRHGVKASPEDYTVIRVDKGQLGDLSAPSEIKNGGLATTSNPIPKGAVIPVDDVPLNELDSGGAESRYASGKSVDQYKAGQLNLDKAKATLKTQLENYGVKVTDKGLDFSQATTGDETDHATIQKVYDDVNKWGDTSPKGIDALNKRMQSYYNKNPDMGPFTLEVKNAVKGELEKLPGYTDMNAKYAEASKNLNDFEKELSLGGKNSTALRNLQTMMKGNAASSDYKRAILDALDEMGGGATKQKLAGLANSPIWGKGLQGAVEGPTVAATAAAHHPYVAAAELAGASPKLMSKLLQYLGAASRGGGTVTNAAMAPFAQNPTLLPLLQLLSSQQR